MSVYNIYGEEIDGGESGNNKDGLICIFKRLGVIGDSLACGLMNLDGSLSDFSKSWLSFMGQRYGIPCENYARGGIATKTWLESTLKTSLQNAEHACDAYFIALCTNDYGEDYPVGTASDEVGADSFCGYLKQIISVVRTKNPNATIFCMSPYSSSSSMKKYGTAITNVCALYPYCFYVDFVNNSAQEIHISPYVGGGHYSQLGYFFISKDVEKLVNEIITKPANKNYFQMLPYGDQ